MEPERMNIKEFREEGYLQELNRQFLHPLGLALEVIQNDDGSEELGGIWDSREDPEGIYYDLHNPENTTQQRLESFKQKADNVAQKISERKKTREENLGFVIEPIPQKI